MAAPRRDDRRRRARGLVRILERRRQQRDQRRRAGHDRLDVLPAPGIGTRGRFRPSRSNQTWGDAGNWQQGDWLNGLRAVLPPPAPTPPPSPGAYTNFPTLSVLGWSTHVRPRFATIIADHVSGRSSRRALSAPRLLRHRTDLRACCAPTRRIRRVPGDRRLLRQMSGAATPFWLAPPGLAERRPGDRDSATGEDDVSRWRGPWRLQRSRARNAQAYRRSIRMASRRRSAGASSAAMRRRSFSRRRPPQASRSRPTSACCWLCRFADDVLDFEEFMAMLWTLKTVALDSAPLTTPPSFPTLAGQGWSVHKKPTFEPSSPARLRA